jgi:uncharacterized protein HemY
MSRSLRFGLRRFVGSFAGNVSVMERTELLAEMLSAQTPNETSTAIHAARRWLADHPEDQAVWSAMADLFEVERQFTKP